MIDMQCMTDYLFIICKFIIFQVNTYIKLKNHRFWQRVELISLGLLCLFGLLVLILILGLKIKCLPVFVLLFIMELPLASFVSLIQAGWMVLELQARILVAFARLLAIIFFYHYIKLTFKVEVGMEGMFEFFSVHME